MTSAVAAAAQRARKAAEDEAKELNRARELMMKGQPGDEGSGVAGPGLRPAASTQTQSVEQEPAAKVRKVSESSDKGAALAKAQADAAAAAKAKAEAEAAAAEALLNRPKWHNKVKSAQWWYYKDQMYTPQGPFYPGQLRDWFLQGYFHENTEVAPSFQGEMPQQYARVVEAFKAPIHETAFVPGAGIANYPPEEQVVEVKKEITKEELARSLMTATPGQEFQKSAISFN